MLHPPSSGSSSPSSGEVVGDPEPEGERQRTEAPPAQRYQRSNKTLKIKAGQEIIDITSSESDDSSQTSHALRSQSNPMSRILPLTLNQFVYQSAPMEASLRSHSTAVVHKGPSNGEDAKPTTSLARKRKGRPVGFGLSEPAVSRLEKCVCCDKRWTTRKTTKQKLNHIQTCSRKHSFTPETVRVLVEKESDTNAEGDTKEPIANTRLEDLVEDTLPKKKSRRTKTRSTVQEYSSEKREVMLKRARAILGPATHPEGKRETADLTISTQPVQLVSQPYVSALDGSIAEGASAKPEGSTPRLLTLTFFPSRLRYQAQKNLGDVSKDNSTSSYGRSDTNALPIVGRPCPCLPEETLACELSELTLGPNNLYDGRHHPIPEPLIEHASPSQRKKKSTTSLKRKSPVKFESKGPGRKPRHEDVSYEQWQADFRYKIVQNDGLYHQILRYEPIHFNIFERLAPVNGSGIQQRQKILAFLDKQAINFYGYRPQKRQQRSRRIS